ncbi:MAG: alcohol dehydrogenase catalytic domain-containing protein [Rhodospirillaceae bacterium]|jgi:threonine dehydrogenase-like Zn-dependent dehydrogenase|nr:alcohol dehydrogenase catalytic domain-containing protein [Rhodospirillaceae bacterium]MBT5940024.1 alcohol dehydrogenase catalytic domain-containing protein [Rhodospirillaceae bacterium]MBT7268312.1 alcohol dehydrogenase catalytic domain-containing protein [Rhodospirillaceae bacterium]
MGKDLQAAVAVKNVETEVWEFDFPETKPEDGLLKVELCGMCGSDWPYYNNYPDKKGPLILGHEGVGYIDRAGASALRRWGMKEGDRVALEEYLPCGHCSYCRTGEFRLCLETDTLNKPDTVRLGSTPVSRSPSLWGAYSQYQYLPENAVFHKVPDHVPAEQAALALPLGNGFEWAYLQGGLKIGEAVLIQGPGQQGLASVVAAAEAGASCIIVSGLTQDQARFDLARELGAHHTIDIEKQDLLETVRDITGGDMVDLVLDCASGGPETIISAINIVRIGGRVMLGGQKRQPIPAFESDLLIRKFLTVKGMRGHSYQSVELALETIASGRYPLEKLCTHTFGLTEVNAGLLTVGGKGEEGAIHCCVDPWN